MLQCSDLDIIASSYNDAKFHYLFFGVKGQYSTLGLMQYEMTPPVALRYANPSATLQREAEDIISIDSDAISECISQSFSGRLGQRRKWGQVQDPHVCTLTQLVDNGPVAPIRLSTPLVCVGDHDVVFPPSL